MVKHFIEVYEHDSEDLQTFMFFNFKDTSEDELDNKHKETRKNINFDLYQR